MLIVTLGIVSDAMSKKFGSIYLEPDRVITEATNVLSDRPCMRGRPSPIHIRKFTNLLIVQHV